MKQISEIRNCKLCDIEYDWFRTNRYGYCKPCRKKEYLIRNRLTEEEKKKSYPLSQNEKQKRHRNIRRELNKCYSREEQRKIFQRELDFIQTNGIYKWCTDLRQPVKTIDEGSGIRGRKANNDIKNKWPDTRNMPE